MQRVVLTVTKNEALTPLIYEMHLAGDVSGVTRAGQFVEIALDGLYLRRPISVCNYEEGELTLIYKVVGKGTDLMSQMAEGTQLDVLTGLGNGFDVDHECERPLLVGGGVGTAPLLYMGAQMKLMGMKPTFLLGARTADMLLQLEEFQKVGDVYVTTEDGSAGEKGFVTQHSILFKEHFDRISVCGPSPMMKAVAKYARANSIPCEVSLENMMACGLGACLCCVEKTTKGNVCVCTEGPVFDINELTWE